MMQEITIWSWSSYLEIPFWREFNLLWLIWIPGTIKYYNKGFYNHCKGKQKYLLSIITNFSILDNTILKLTQLSKSSAFCQTITFIWSISKHMLVDVNRPIILYNSQKMYVHSLHKSYFQISTLSENKYSYLPYVIFCHMQSLSFA